MKTWIVYLRGGGKLHVEAQQHRAITDNRIVIFFGTEEEKHLPVATFNIDEIIGIVLSNGAGKEAA